MKTNTAQTINKKLILHFDVENVIQLPTQVDKDFYVYEICSKWVWGKLQKNSKQDPDKVTGWKIALTNLIQQSSDPQLVSYHQYLSDYLKPTKEDYEKLIMNLSKGAASKAKGEIQKNIKNITLPKTLYETLKELNDPNNKLLSYYVKTCKYQILPAFYKFLMSLKKNKRQFAIVIHNNKYKDNHFEIINELNLFFSGEHPLFNGKNGTPLIKWDGSKGTKNYLIEDTHEAVLYSLGEKQLFATYGTLNIAQQKDPQMFKQKFKSFKSVKLCQGAEQIYSVSHSIIAESACIYEVNPLHTIIVDPVDYLTHEIYFTTSVTPKVVSCLGQQISDNKNYIIKVNLFDYLKDVDYFVKATEVIENNRAAEILRTEKGEIVAQEQLADEHTNHQENKHLQTNSQYLQKHLLPVLEGALRQVDLLRPKDPLGFIALYCLKNKDRLE